MEMILSWSSSLTQVRKVFSLLWKMPLPSGQSLSIPATLRLGSPETKRKWSSTNCCLTVSFIPVRGKVGASKVILEVGKSFLHQVLHSKPLLLSNPGRQAKPIDGSSNSDAGGLDRGLRVNVALDLGGVHIT